MKKQTMQQLKKAILPAGKKLFIAVLISATFASAAFAGPADVSSTALNNLTYEFKNAKDVVWKVTAIYTYASFTYNGEKMEVCYNNDGDLIGVSRIISNDELPQKANKKIAKEYAGYKTAEAIEFKNAEDETTFYISLLKDASKIILQVETNGDVSIFKPAPLQK